MIKYNEAPITIPNVSKEDRELLQEGVILKPKYKIIFYKGDYYIFKRILGLIYWPTINYFHTKENATNFCKKLNYYNDKKY